MSLTSIWRHRVRGRKEPRRNQPSQSQARYSKPGIWRTDQACDIKRPAASQVCLLDRDVVGATAAQLGGTEMRIHTFPSIQELPPSSSLRETKSNLEKGEITPDLSAHLPCFCFLRHCDSPLFLLGHRIALRGAFIFLNVYMQPHIRTSAPRQSSTTALYPDSIP